MRTITVGSYLPASMASGAATCEDQVVREVVGRDLVNDDVENGIDRGEISRGAALRKLHSTVINTCTGVTCGVCAVETGGLKDAT